MAGIKNFSFRNDVFLIFQYFIHLLVFLALRLYPVNAANCYVGRLSLHNQRNRGCILELWCCCAKVVVVTDWNGIASNSLFCDVKHPQFK
jgi:hypothetical protein